MSESEELELEVFADRSGTGPATWGQKAIWDAVSLLDDEDAPRYNMSIGFELEPGCPRAVVLDAVTDAARLHESLRTRLEPDTAGELTQILDATGRIPVVIVRSARGETKRVGEELLNRLRADAFDVAGRWPIRIGLVEADGLVHHYAMTLSHTAADGGALRRLARDVLMLMGDVSAEQLRKLYPATQPLDEAAYQNSDRGRRRDAASRRHWRTKLDSGPRQLFPERTERVPDALVPNVLLSSPALLLAVDHLSAVRRVSGSSILLAAATQQVATMADTPEMLFQVVVNNRFLPGMAQTITTLAQEGLFHVREVDKDFGDLVQRVHAGALSAYRHASYDKRQLDQDIEQLRADLPDIADYSCTFNDTREPELFRFGATTIERPPLAKAREQSTLLRREFPARKDFTFALDAIDAPGAVELTMTTDAALLPHEDIERFLLGMEETIVADALATGCV